MNFNSVLELIQTELVVWIHTRYDHSSHYSPNKPWWNRSITHSQKSLRKRQHIDWRRLWLHSSLAYCSQRVRPEWRCYPLSMLHCHCIFSPRRNECWWPIVEFSYWLLIFETMLGSVEETSEGEVSVRILRVCACRKRRVQVVAKVKRDSFRRRRRCGDGGMLVSLGIW